MKTVIIKKSVSMLLLFIISMSIVMVDGTVKASSSSTSYYIDAVEGNDSSDGTSPSTAWQSLDKVNGTNFQPGDKVLFKAGGVWIGQLAPKGSGANGNPIVVDMYGDGAKPLIDGNGRFGDLNNNGAAVLLYNQDYWEINNLQITNKATDEQPRFGVLVRWHDYGTGQHVYIKNCDIYDISGKYTVATGYTGQRFQGDGIIFVSTGADSKGVQTNFNDILIEGNTLKNIYRTGISIWSQWEDRQGGPTYYGAIGFHNTVGAYKASTNVVIRGNSLDTMAGDGILINTTDHALVENNIVKDANKFCNPATDPNAGIWPHNSDNTVMQYNEVYNTRNTSDGQGFDVDYNCSNAILQYNYSHDNEGGFLLLMETAHAPIIRYNISQNDNKALLDYRASSALFNNNTFYMKADLSRQGSGPDSGATFINNIFYAPEALQISSWGSANYMANSYYNLNSTPNDSYKIMDNPLMESPGNGTVGMTTPTGYQLKSGSPLINKGVKITDRTDKDYWGNLLDDVQDIGASDTKTSGGTAPASYTPGQSLNLAIGSTVSASSSLESWGWSKAAVVDGQRSSISNAKGYASAWGQTANHSEWLELNMGARKTFNSVILFPQSGAGGSGFPVDFKIQVWNGSEWLDRVVKTGYSINDDAGQVFSWGYADTTDKIRIYATSLQNLGNDGYMMKLAEVEVRNVQNTLSSHAAVQASSSIENYGWFKSAVVDGKRQSSSGAMGYSSELGQNSDHSEWIEITLPSAKTFNTVTLFPRSDSNGSFPKEFKIQVWDGSNWLDRVCKSGYSLNQTAGQLFTWGYSDTSDKIRISASGLPKIGSDGYMLQLAEIEVTQD
ncbi:discoidin domain-containing protein [Paenibacillus barcinonensis]|uniref:discoidin domain-containing protein n=1 Tax=Paenibacillus barcinonensis TaxID=198119 RepID=UPI001C0FF0F7|nr:discoidin domain-containing protein [Paenibacillus barcinonensis]MBU5352187.1 discoidin domain-containing protein [Paenibacillus barcinonensis]